MSEHGHRTPSPQPEPPERPYAVERERDDEGYHRTPVSSCCGSQIGCVPAGSVMYVPLQFLDDWDDYSDHRCARCNLPVVHSAPTEPDTSTREASPGLREFAAGKLGPELRHAARGWLVSLPAAGTDQLRAWLADRDASPDPVDPPEPLAAFLRRATEAVAAVVAEAYPR